MNKSLISALAALCLSSFSVGVTAAVNDGQESPVAVDIVFVPDGLAFGTHINDAVLRKIGCTYLVQDPVISSTLLKLAVWARDLPQDSVNPKQKFETRNKLVFHFQNKDDLSVTFSQKYSNQTYLEATWNSAPIHLNIDLTEKIRAIVRGTRVEQSNKNAPASCDEV